MKEFQEEDWTKKPEVLKISEPEVSGPVLRLSPLLLTQNDINNLLI